METRTFHFHGFGHMDGWVDNLKTTGLARGSLTRLEAAGLATSSNWQDILYHDRAYCILCCDCILSI